MKVKRFSVLRGLRLQLGISQEEMSKLLGIGTTAYSSKECGRNAFKLDELVIIRDFINKLLKKDNKEEMTIDQIFLP